MADPKPVPGMNNPRVVTLTAVIVIEVPPGGDLDATEMWVKSRLKAALDPSNRGCISIAISGPGGETRNIVGTPKAMSMDDLNRLLNNVGGQ